MAHVLVSGTATTDAFGPDRVNFILFDYLGCGGFVGSPSGSGELLLGRLVFLISVIVFPNCGGECAGGARLYIRQLPYSQGWG